MTKNGTATAPARFDLFMNASASQAHLAPSTGGGFVCGTPAGRSKWACHAVNITAVLPTFPCPACREAAPMPAK